MSYYSGGTVTVSNGDDHVQGSGTVFVAQVRPGDLFTQGGYAGIVKSILGSTEFVLEEEWAGPDASAVPYVIAHISDEWHSTVTINEQLTRIIQDIEAGIGFKPDATGSISERSNYDTAEKSFIFMRTDSDPFELYVKASASSGDWTGPASFQGPEGPQGVQGETGLTGPSINLTVGTVIPGDTAGATITGTSPNKVLNLTLPQGEAGTDGSNGWTPHYAVVSDSVRRVLQIVDWVGGEGTKPATGQYVSATGLTSTLADGVDIRGTTGATGPANTLSVGTVTTGSAGSSVSISITGSAPTQTANFTIPRGDTGAAGSDGTDGWTPVYAIVSDSARRVLQIVDWTGGEGTKPTTGQYVSATGLTSTLASGVDIRGAAGATGPANTLSIGTVTTGAAGSSAVATVTGSAPTQTLNLVIPKGDTGDNGTPIEIRGNDIDEQLEWRVVGDTEWSLLTTYSAIQAATQTDFGPDIAAAKSAAIGIGFLF